MASSLRNIFRTKAPGDFGRCYAAEPYVLIEEREKDEAINEADALDPSPNLVGIYQFPSSSGKRTLERYTLGGWQSQWRTSRTEWQPGCNTRSLWYFRRECHTTLKSSPGNATYGRYFNTCYRNAAGALVMTTPTAPACDSTSSIPAFQQHFAFTLNNIGPYMSDVRQRVHPLFDFTLFKQFSAARVSQLRDS